MTHSIYSIDQIKLMAREAAQAGKTIIDCPFEAGTSHYDHWSTEFHRAAIELRAEVES